MIRRSMLFLAIAACAEGQLASHGPNDPRNPNAPEGAAPKAVSEASHDVYACSMHPEVTSDKPGRCPKCGMELEKRAPK